MLISKDFTFEAAHFLIGYDPKTDEGKKVLRSRSKCERMHGHSYKLRVTIEGNIKEHGMVMDFFDLKEIVQKQVLEQFDHHLINDYIANPTAENMAVFIWNKLEKDIAAFGNKLYEIELFETATSRVLYRGKEGFTEQ